MDLRSERPSNSIVSPDRFVLDYKIAPNRPPLLVNNIELRDG